MKRIFKDCQREPLELQCQRRSSITECGHVLYIKRKSYCEIVYCKICGLAKLLHNLTHVEQLTDIRSVIDHEFYDSSFSSTNVIKIRQYLNLLHFPKLIHLYMINSFAYCSQLLCKKFLKKKLLLSCDNPINLFYINKLNFIL